MSYRYHVECTKDFDSMLSIRTYKYEKFSDAFEQFVFQSNKRALDKTFSWSVVLYDMELCDIKCSVDSTDFE